MAKLVNLTEYRAYHAISAQGFNEWRAYLFLYTSDPAVRCSLRFVDDEAAWVDKQTVNENGVSTVYLSYDRFEEVLHILQTEKPLYLTLYGPPTNRAIIQTAQEAVGEEEGS